MGEGCIDMFAQGTRHGMRIWCAIFTAEEGNIGKDHAGMEGANLELLLGGSRKCHPIIDLGRVSTNARVKEGSPVWPGADNGESVGRQ